MKTYLVALTLAFSAVSTAPALAQDTPIDVKKTNGCGCCIGWMQNLEENGFAPTGEDIILGVLARLKIDSGVPQSMASCHTAFIDGYVIEGHVPAADIRRLLDERPDAVGLAVPGMPYGSPGMGPEEDREAYDVFLITKSGSTEVFSYYAEN